jgi:twitching motility two-component system response regulator PilH
VAEPVVPAVAAGAYLGGYRVLVVDDEPDFVTFVSAVLEDNGARVVRAYSADDALEVARREKPDLMTLDISMPGKSGDEVFVEIRRDPDLKTMPICIITGQPELRKLIYDRPVPPPEGYLDKPVDEEQLLFNIRKVLKLQHHGDGVGARKLN